MTTPDARYSCSQAENTSVSAVGPHLLLPLLSMLLLCLISGKMTLLQNKSIFYLLKEHTECFEGDTQIICSPKRNLKVSKQREENAY